MQAKPPRTQQERVYGQLREAILRGQFVPGRSVTLRGIAQMLDVSPMPVREALRRLTAERALELLSNRRIAVPTMSLAKLSEISTAREALETQAALRALPAITSACLQQLRECDDEVTAAIARHDVEAYIYGNYQFHALLYGPGQSEVIMPLIESLWLQMAPFMRLVLDRFGLGDLPDRHQQAITAIEAGDAMALEQAIRQDVRETVAGINQAQLDELYVSQTEA